MNETSTPVTPAIPVIPDKAEKKQIRAYYNKGAAVMLIFTLLHLIIQIFVSFIDTENVNPSFLQLINMLLMATIEIAAIAGGCFFTGLDWKSFFKSRDGYNGKSIFKAYITTQGLGYLGAFLGVIVITIMSLFGANVDVPLVTDTPDSASSAILAVYGILFAPSLEETLCRGVLLNGIKKYNKTLALIVSSLAFGLIHGNAHQFIYATVMGLVLGFVALKANSVIPSIFTHMGVNAMAFTFQILMTKTGYMEFAQKMTEMSDPQAFLTDPTSGLSSFMGLAIFLLTYIGAIIIAAVTLTIINRKKFRKYCPKANALGKSRGLPIFLTSPVWIIIIVYYLAVIFVLPFLGGAT
jgi:membrane protease YdiL (CAAX protease family)